MGDVNKLYVCKSLLTTPSNVLPLHHKQTFPPIIWIFTERDGIESRLPFKIFSTLIFKEFCCNLTLPSRNFVGWMTLFFKNYLTTCVSDWGYRWLGLIVDRLGIFSRSPRWERKSYKIINCFVKKSGWLNNFTHYNIFSTF